MPGFSQDLNNRFTKPWMERNLNGNGIVSLPQRRHSIVVEKSKLKSKKRKRSDSMKRQSKKF